VDGAWTSIQPQFDKRSYIRTRYSRRCTLTLESDLSAGRANAAVQLQVALQDVAEFGGGVSLDQPGPGQQARQEGLQVLQELIHRQATRPPHRPVQSRQRVRRSPGEPRRRAGRLLLLQTLGGLPERNTRDGVDVLFYSVSYCDVEWKVDVALC